MPKAQQPTWHHYEKWQLSMDDTHTTVENHGKHGYYLRIGIAASARGAECYEQEIDKLIAALTETKAKITAIKKTKGGA